MNHSRIIKVKGKRITYNYYGPSKDTELKALDSYIAGAYLMTIESHNLLVDFDISTSNFFEMIFDDSSKESVEKVKKSYANIVRRIEKEINIVRVATFIDKDSKQIDSVLSAAKVDGKGFVCIYDAFFKSAKGDDKNLNDRSTVILHEVGHLVGFLSDAETESTQSAECLRNFTLLVCGIVKSEDLFIEKSENESEDDSDSDEPQLIGQNGELPNNPNQPRAPKGQSNGGQWVAEGGGSGNSTKEENSPKSESENNKNSSSSDESANTEAKKENTVPENKKGGSSIALINGEIKYDPEGKASRSWAATDLKIDGQKPNTRMTVVIDYEYSYENAEGESVSESAKIAIDAITDKDGKIEIDRVGILGEYFSNPSNDKWQGTDLDVKITVSTVEGCVKGNYGEPDRISTPNYPEYENHVTRQEKEIEEQERMPGHDKYGLAYYPVTHASYPNDIWFKTPKPKDYTGGGISGKKDPDSIKKVSEFEMHYDSQKKETEIRKGNITRDGKGYDDNRKPGS